MCVSQRLLITGRHRFANGALMLRSVNVIPSQRKYLTGVKPDLQNQSPLLVVAGSFRRSKKCAALKWTKNESHPEHLQDCQSVHHP